VLPAHGALDLVREARALDDAQTLLHERLRAGGSARPRGAAAGAAALTSYCSSMMASIVPSRAARCRAAISAGSARRRV
jgi:hypothetical protein